MYKVSEIEYSCPAEALSNLLGKKWVPAILWTLQQEESVRFGELQRRLERCSKKMLMQQLELLMEQGIVENYKQVQGNTIESSYSLSEMGKTLIPVIRQMIEWGNANLTCS